MVASYHKGMNVNIWCADDDSDEYGAVRKGTPNGCS